MSMKASHAADTKGIAGRTRSHIISRLEKAARAAENLVEILSNSKEAGASAGDILEARAYAALIRGTASFEKQSWEPCIRSYAIAHVIYGAFSTSSKGDIYKDLLTETIDPSIRYAAYQLKTPRTIPVPTIARKAFPMSDTALVQEINKIDPDILKQNDLESKKGQLGAENAPKTLAWRSREVRIEDAAIAVAWGSIQEAKKRLAEKLSSLSGRESKEVAAAYDEILTASQDAVDATKQAIDELKGEGVTQSDARMQSLQITWTAVNYEMVSWRIGRNRVLTGEQDGALEQVGTTSKRKLKKEEEKSKKQSKEDTPSRRIARLKEKAALYDATLQSLETVKALPGVPADESLSGLLDSTAKYFGALK
jgi:signal recognition particle subunit SRP68